MGWWPFGKKSPGRNLPNEVERIFEKLSRFLDDESAQNDALPDDYRRRLLANPPCDHIANGFGEFGRTPTNPIPVNGPIGELIYLSSLAIAVDVPVAFHRIGSQGEIDVFEALSEDGRLWDVLYLSMYFPRKSRAVPAGYQRISDRRRLSLIRGTTTLINGFPANIHEATAECSTRFLGMSIADPELKSLERSQPIRTQRHMAVLRQLEFSGRQAFDGTSGDEGREFTDDDHDLLPLFDKIFTWMKRTTEKSADTLEASLSSEFERELSYVLLYLFSVMLFQGTSRRNPGQVADQLAKSCFTRLATREDVSLGILLRDYRARFDSFKKIDLFMTQDRFLINEGALTLGGLIVTPANMAFGAIFMNIFTVSIDPLRDHLASV